MDCIAAFDIGTTAVKAALVEESGQVRKQLSREIPTIYEGEFREQDPRVWQKAFAALSEELLRICPPEKILGIVMSGQMQDVIPVDARLQPLCPAILYNDGRAVAEAEELKERSGAERILAVTGNHCDGTLSIPKIMWLKRHRPGVYGQARSFLISSKDYVIAALTGVCAGDRTACSTAGGMELQTGAWSAEVLRGAGIVPEKMPVILSSHALAGRVHAEAAAWSGYREGTPVYAGVGDAGATTLASGIMSVGQYNINLGTSGWVATISDKARYNEGGIFNLAAMPEGKVINVVPFLNAGNVHRWVSTLFSREAEPDYAYLEKLLDESVPGAHGVFALPYLVGERFPVLDPKSRGSFVGITPETGPGDLARAMLEGVAFSIRQGMEMIGEAPLSVSVIGGGGRVGVWCRILADVLGQRLTVFRDADTLPARAVAAAALIGAGRSPGYERFSEQLNADQAAVVYEPDPDSEKIYRNLYQRYKGLYRALRSWYGE